MIRVVVRRSLSFTIVATLAIATSTAASAAGGNRGVATRTVTFVDESRRTESNPMSGQAVADARTLRTTIWFPRAPAGPFPLIVFAHGAGSRPETYEPTLRRWARHGYVVAAPAFPVSSRRSPGRAASLDLPNQPDDVSFVIDKLLALDRADGGLGGIIDEAHIGAAGHSLGAATTLALGFRSCCADPRVDAVVSYAGAPAISGTDFTRSPIPLLVVYGDSDHTNIVRGSRRAYGQAAGPRFLLTVVGGDHGSWLHSSGAPARAVRLATMEFWGAYLQGDDGAAPRLQRHAVVEGRTRLKVKGG